jgi:ATP-dependent DNA helicase RecG
MVFSESETVELKREYIKDIRKEIVAFANTEGGTIYIGVEDSGEVIGLDNPDEVMLAVLNSARDSVRPDIMSFINGKTLEIDGKKIVQIDIQKGPDCPYYLRDKGLVPNGVYIRNGSASNPASTYIIKRMISESLGSFEDMLSIEQDLTFGQIMNEFEKHSLDFGDSQMYSLGIKNKDGMYTNLGLLVSDQCPHIIKGAVFKGVDCLDFQDREEFSGSVFKQLNEAYRYIELNNHTSATFNGLYRHDQLCYPPVALREALINAVVHRDYSSVNVSNKISFFADRMEILSYGGLPTDITLEMAMNGVSACRNPKLANIFYRLKLIEMYGTGFGKMQAGYASEDKESDVFNPYHRQPKFEAVQGAFKVIMPNLAYHEKKNVVYEDGPRYVTEHWENRVETKIIELIGEKGQITRPDVERTLGVSLSTATRILRGLKEKGKIVSVGRGRSTVYILAL